MLLPGVSSAWEHTAGVDDLVKVADSHDLNQCKGKLESMSRQLKADQFVSFIQ